MSEPCIDQVPREDPRIKLIVNMVANAYGHRLPFDLASYATQHGRIDMARELLAALDKHQRSSLDASQARHNHEFYVMCPCGIRADQFFSHDESVEHILGDQR